ncbi:hypothetical protein MTO96_030869 [Rhipicephalus appendiculatus]
MLYSSDLPDEDNELVFPVEEEAPVISPGSEPNTIPETSEAHYEERRETIADCLVATAVLLTVILCFLMFTFVALGIHFEVHTFGYDEPTSDSPGFVVPLDIYESIEESLPNTGTINFHATYANDEYHAFDKDHYEGYIRDCNHDYEHGFNNDFKHDYKHGSKHHDYKPYFEYDHKLDLKYDFNQDFNHDYKYDFEHDYKPYFEYDHNLDLKYDFNQDFNHDYNHDYKHDYNYRSPSFRTLTCLNICPFNTTLPQKHNMQPNYLGKLVLDGVLLCTLRASLSIRAFVYPDDGVCAITMFNSLFVTGGSTLTPPYKSELVHFLDTASHHNRTQYGIAIDHKNETFMRALAAQQATKTSLYEMWSHRVYHYGQVNTPPILTGFDTVHYITQSAKGLQLISQLMKDKADSEDQSSYTVLHYPMMYESMASDVAKALTAYPVDLFVAIGYTAYSDYAQKQCRMVPPILDSTKLLEPALLNDSYPVRLVRVISALNNLKKEWKNTTALAVSVGMGGRWYIPAFPDRDIDIPGNYSLGHHCKTTSRGDAPPRHQISSIAECCEDLRYNETFSFDHTFKAMLAYDKSDHGLFTYDSALSFRLKLCDTKKNVTDLHYNIVADDIQYDDIENVCGYGEYSRLHTLNRLAAFLGKNYTSRDQGITCKLVT